MVEGSIKQVGTTVTTPSFSVVDNLKMFFGPVYAATNQERLELKKYFFKSQTILLI